jgi:hypothetical protein
MEGNYLSGVANAGAGSEAMRKRTLQQAKRIISTANQLERRRVQSPTSSSDGLEAESTDRSKFQMSKRSERLNVMKKSWHDKQ